jgi:ankyrin repeat protein
MVPADGDSRTALYRASQHGDLEVVTLLLENGAEVNAKSTSFAIPRIYTDIKY